jgi:hypothetical protein
VYGSSPSKSQAAQSGGWAVHGLYIQTVQRAAIIHDGLNHYSFFDKNLKVPFDEND